MNTSWPGSKGHSEHKKQLEHSNEVKEASHSEGGTNNCVFRVGEGGGKGWGAEPA